MNDWYLANLSFQAFTEDYPNSIYVDEVKPKLLAINEWLSGVIQQDCERLTIEGKELTQQGEFIMAMDRQQLALACYEAESDITNNAKVQLKIASL